LLLEKSYFPSLLTLQDTTAQTVVQLALVEFGLVSNNSSSSNSDQTDKGTEEWSLCEVIVSPDSFIRQRRLPDSMQNLAERISMNSRLVWFSCISTNREPICPKMFLFGICYDKYDRYFVHYWH